MGVCASQPLEAGTHELEAQPAKQQAQDVYKEGHGAPFWACCCSSVSEWGEVKLGSQGFKRWDELPVEIKTLDSEGVEKSMAYAKTGSAIPEGLHGLWWADQLWASSVAKDPAFQAELPFQEPPFYLPILVGFGDWPTEWRKEESRLGPLGYGGLKGHWAFLGEDGATYDPVTFDFCAEDAELERFRLEYRQGFLGIEGVAVTNWGLPPSLMDMYMVKRPWGWARTNTIGPDVWDALPKGLQDIVERTWPASLVQLLRLGEKGAWQYPVLQIVDGEGRRTKYYDEYLKFMQGQEREGRKVKVTVFKQ